MIQLKNITKRYDNKVALEDVSLEAKDGEITSLVGANGAGKSTTINIIAGYISKDSGQLSGNHVSIMPDADNLYADMTGLAFLKYIGDLKGADSQEALSLADRLGIANDLSKKIKSYSFGMKKKIAFISAYIGDFKNYIFDEPTSGVDYTSAKIMTDLLTDLKRDGCAIMLTSHNLNEIEEVSDQVYYLKNGSIYTRSMISIETVTFGVEALEPFNNLEDIFLDVPYHGLTDRQLTFSASRQKAAQILNQLIQKNNVVIQFGPVHSEVEEAMEKLNKD